MYVVFCDVCGKGFKLVLGYYIYKKMFYSVECNYLMCKICGKKFVSLSWFFVYLRLYLE